MEYEYTIISIIYNNIYIYVHTHTHIDLMRFDAGRVFYHPLMSHQRQRGAGTATQTQFFKQSKEGRAIVLFGLVLGASTNVGGMDSYGSYGIQIRQWTNITKSTLLTKTGLSKAVNLGQINVVFFNYVDCQEIAIYS